MKKMYAISNGSYSDYRVTALFPTRELAEAAAQASNGRKDGWADYFVESFPVYDEVPEPVTSYKRSVTVWDSGEETNVREESETALPWDHFWEPPLRPKSRYVRAPILARGRLDVYGRYKATVDQAYSDGLARLRYLRDIGVTPDQEIETGGDEA